MENLNSKFVAQMNHTGAVAEWFCDSNKRLKKFNQNDVKEYE